MKNLYDYFRPVREEARLYSEDEIDQAIDEAVTGARMVGVGKNLVRALRERDAQIARLRVALNHYADRENWHLHEYQDGGDDWMWWRGDDPWTVAEEALG